MLALSMATRPWYLLHKMVVSRWAISFIVSFLKKLGCRSSSKCQIWSESAKWWGNHRDYSGLVFWPFRNCFTSFAIRSEPRFAGSKSANSEAVLCYWIRQGTWESWLHHAAWEGKALIFSAYKILQMNKYNLSGWTGKIRNRRSKREHLLITPRITLHDLGYDLATV